MKNKIEDILIGLKEELIELSEYILENPEMGHKEYKSMNKHVELLEKHGFKVEKNYMNMETAFKATFDTGKKGATVAYLSEYDALPGIGHGCGHNILGATSTGAGILLSKLIKGKEGKVIVFGTPAEETSGGKVHMAEGGAFSDVDVCLIAHPSDKHYKSGKSLAMDAIEFTYRGQTAHAAANPDKGINALDACINTFNNINSMREHIRSDARVHGIIKNGGEAANIVPDLAVAQFYTRATTREYLEELTERLKNCARGASIAAGTELEIRNYELSYDNMITNETLSNIYTERLRKMGVQEILEPKEDQGSLDTGNVSHVCPSIHPTFAISNDELIGHTVEFRDATKTEYAYGEMAKVVGSLAWTGYDVIEDEKILNKIKDEFSINTRR